MLSRPGRASAPASCARPCLPAPCTQTTLRPRPYSPPLPSPPLPSPPPQPARSSLEAHYYTGTGHHLFRTNHTVNVSGQEGPAPASRAARGPRSPPRTAPRGACVPRVPCPPSESHPQPSPTPPPTPTPTTGARQGRAREDHRHRGRGARCVARRPPAPCLARVRDAPPAVATACARAPRTHARLAVLRWHRSLPVLTPPPCAHTCYSLPYPSLQPPTSTARWRSMTTTRPRSSTSAIPAASEPETGAGCTRAPPGGVHAMLGARPPARAAAGPRARAAPPRRSPRLCPPRHAGWTTATPLWAGCTARTTSSWSRASTWAPSRCRRA